MSADRLERHLELIGGSRQFGALGDHEAAAFVVELRPTEQGPPSSVGRPSPVFVSTGSGCEVRQGQDGQVNTGTAAIVTVSLRIDPGCRAQASRHDLAVGHEGQSEALACQGDLVRVLADTVQGEESGQDQARCDQRGQAPPQRFEAGPDPALGRAQRQFEEVGDLLVC